VRGPTGRRQATRLHPAGTLFQDLATLRKRLAALEAKNAELKDPACP
jgi:hypothetical protein